MAAPVRIVPFTVMLFFGQVLPVLWLPVAALEHGPLFWPLVAVAAGYLPRLFCLLRFRQSAFGAALHPAGVAVLLLLQWWSLGRKLLKGRITWKERVYPFA